MKAEAAAEPMLSSFLHAAVIAQPSLTAAVVWVLSHRLDGTDGGALDPVRFDLPFWPFALHACLLSGLPRGM